jgi:carboxylate-amine ligase
MVMTMQQPPASPPASSSALTLGVEEEFHLVDLGTRRLSPRAGEVLARLPGDTYAAELQQTVVETNTAVSSSLAELRASLVELRRRLIAACDSLGLGLAGAGSMPLTAPHLEVTDVPRYQQMLANYQLLVREQLICGMQVHVGIADRDLAVALMQRVAPWLPPLLALSASSPYGHDGLDTGYASARWLTWQRWPTAGTSGGVASAAEYDALVADLVSSGVISDPGMIYFDVRPSAHVPTIELRICDACPSVDTVVLIAGLFRAVVAREMADELAGIPRRPFPEPLARASMWRAARSGLEDELVDPRDGRPAPAATVVRGMVDALRPELEASGDWDEIVRLTAAALELGSAAARQRSALASHARIRDVVDEVLVETRAGLGIDPAPPLTDTLLDGYLAPGFDEALARQGVVREEHTHVLETLTALGPVELRERLVLLDRAKHDAKLVFRATDADEATPYPVDLVPRVVSHTDWSVLADGLVQRGRALDAFLRDVYGAREIVKDGLLPASLIDSSPGLRDAGTAVPDGAVHAHVCGFDVVRGADGRWLVLEDNLRVPSGMGFSLAARRLTREVFPELGVPDTLLDPERAPALLRTTLWESAPPLMPDDGPHVVLLSDGPSDSAFFEHQLLAGELDIPVLVPADLFVEDDVLYRRYDDRDRSHRGRVDVVYVRIDEDVAETRPGADGLPLGPALVAAVRAGRLTLANAFGNGVGDDKAVYAYVPTFIDYYLGEHPVVEQVPTYLCAEPEARDHVLSRLGELVVKPVNGYGGRGVLVGPRATEQELVDLRASVIADPGGFIAQDVIALSTHPTFDGSVLSPRHVDLRAFALLGREAVAAPVALTRVAAEGSMIVNSSRGGGSKDTWLFGTPIRTEG